VGAFGKRRGAVWWVVTKKGKKKRKMDENSTNKTRQDKIVLRLDKGKSGIGERDSHFSEGCVHGGAAHLYGDDGVESRNGGLERLE
jgi:hypothetical protein